MLEIRRHRATRHGQEWTFALDGLGGAPGAAAAELRVDPQGNWQCDSPLTSEAESFLDLYLPLALAGAEQPMTLAHLGQSLDGRIAAENGDSYYVTGPENIDHLHRLRALCDAVVVGASTVAIDNPRLTTRRVEGENPVRVIVDPDCRTASDRGVVRDGDSETLIVCREDCVIREPILGNAVLVKIPRDGSELQAKRIVASLHERGLHALFVEGGGVTVSRFLREGLLDRLHVAVAPMILGSGRPGLTLPRIDSLSAALRPDCRSYPMGGDVLFDCRFTR